MKTISIRNLNFYIFFFFAFLMKIQAAYSYQVFCPEPYQIKESLENGIYRYSATTDGKKILFTSKTIPHPAQEERAPIRFISHRIPMKDDANRRLVCLYKIGNRDTTFWLQSADIMDYYNCELHGINLYFDCK